MQLRAEFLQRRDPAGEDDGMTENDLQKLRNYARRLEFPGSQPVSLSNDNQDLLHRHRCARMLRLLCCAVLCGLQVHPSLLATHTAAFPHLGPKSLPDLYVEGTQHEETSVCVPSRRDGICMLGL